MAALILDFARTTREEAERLRVESVALRLAVRRSNKLTHASTERAAAAAAARRPLRVASPWSGLYWLREDDSLDRTLLSVD